MKDAMKKMTKSLEPLRGLDPLRTAMTAVPGRGAAAALCAGLCALFFAAALVLCGGMEGAAAIAAVGALGVAILLAGAYFPLVKERVPVILWLCVGLLAMAAVGAHLAMLDIKPGRYGKILAPLFENMNYYELVTAMAWDEHAWSGGYLLVCALLSRLSDFSLLYAVKLFDLVCQCACAAAVARLAALRGAKTPGIIAGMMACVLAPTMLFNAGLWAQCDATFAMLTLWGLCLAVDDHPLAGSVLLGMAAATKLQSAFVFPVLIVLFYNRKLQLRHFAVMLAAFVALQAAILLDGYTLAELFGRYGLQIDMAAEEIGLADNAPGVYGLMKVASVREFSGMGRCFGLACALLVVLAMLRSRTEMTHDTLLLGALLLAAGLPLVLPQMNTRCLYLAGMLAFAMAGTPRRMTACALLEVTSLCGYMKSVFNVEILPIQALSLLAIGAACLIAYELIDALRGQTREARV